MYIAKQAVERRKDILEAATQLFLEKGYANTSMTEIANKVGVVKGTCYHYFPTKELLYHEVLQHEGEKFILHINQILVCKELSAEKRLIRMLEIAAKRIKNSTNAKHKIHTETIDFIRLQCFQQLSIHMAECIRDGNAQGCFNAAQPTLCANAICYAIFGITSAKAPANEMIEAMYQSTAALLSISIAQLKETK